MKLDSANPLAVEIHQEMAAAYFGACRKMVDALEALQSFDRANARIPHPEQTTRRCELIEEAAERVYYVLIQREAMELSHNPAFFDHYGIPDEVRRRLGPKRQRV
jgi:hypothetical protein